MALLTLLILLPCREIDFEIRGRAVRVDVAVDFVVVGFGVEVFAIARGGGGEGSCESNEEEEGKEVHGW